MRSHAAIVAHELGHSCALIAQGVVPASIDVTGRGEFLGLVTYPSSFAGRTDYAAARIEAKSIISGWLCEVGRPASWPLGYADDDERDLRNIADAFHWSRADYESIVAETRRLMATPAFRRPYERLYAALCRTPYLTHADIKRVVGVRYKAARATTDPMEAVRELERQWQDEEARSIIERFEAGVL